MEGGKGAKVTNSSLLEEDCLKNDIIPWQPAAAAVLHVLSERSQNGSKWVRVILNENGGGGAAAAAKEGSLAAAGSEIVVTITVLVAAAASASAGVAGKSERNMCSTRPYYRKLERERAKEGSIGVMGVTHEKSRDDGLGGRRMADDWTTT